jgi:putative transposase
MALSLIYLGLCRVLGLVASWRRSGSDKDLEIVVLRHQVRVLERQLHARVRYQPADRAILARRADCSRGRWRCFLVTPDTLLRWPESSQSANGGDGEHNGVRAGRR